MHRPFDLSSELARILCGHPGWKFNELRIFPAVRNSVAPRVTALTAFRI